MFGSFARQGRGVLVLLTVLAIVLAACGSSGSKGTAAPSNSGGGLVVPTTANGGGGGDNGSLLGGAAAKLDDIASYKFSMTFAGTYFGSYLGMLGGGASATAGAPVTFSGTVITKPAKAADITIGGMHIIEVDGMQYMDLGAGTFYSSPATGTSLADSFSPSSFFSMGVDSSSASGYKLVGEEQKNGVTALHLQADAAALKSYGSIFGVPNGTWSADTWIAKDGGYPVSMSIVGKAADGTDAFGLSFDITNINDPGLKVTKPANVAN